MGTVGSPALEILLEGMKIDDLALQVAVINALGSLGDSRAADVLESAAKDEAVDPYIRESATSALSRLESVMKFKSINNS